MSVKERQHAKRSAFLDRAKHEADYVEMKTALADPDESHGLEMPDSPKLHPHLSKRRWEKVAGAWRSHVRIIVMILRLAKHTRSLRSQ